jgi:hypothetical protein
MARYVASACFTCVSALTLVLVGVQVAQAGPSHGTAYAEWLASSAVVGQTVGLAVRTTDDLSAPGSQYPGGSFTVTYDQNTLTFAGHKNPGSCSLEPVVSDPSVPVVLNQLASCPESYDGAGTTKYDTFYFTVSPSARSGTATVWAQANYGAVRSSAAVATLAVSAGDPRLQYTNGCTMSPDRIPKLITIKDLCDMHDVLYARFPDGHHEYGTNELGRLRADNVFLGAMLSRCNSTYSWYDPRRDLCARSALVYYTAVRTFGAAFYYDYNTRF